MVDFETAILASQLKTETLELVLIRLGEHYFGIRAAAVQRLEKLSLALLLRPEFESHPALCGFLRVNQLPVFDLARLLGLESRVMPEQLLQMESGGRRAGFMVEQAAEVVRVGLDELALIPAIIEQHRLRPAAWALWRKSEQEIIVLIEPIESLSAEEWQQISKQGAEPK